MNDALKACAICGKLCDPDQMKVGRDIDECSAYICKECYAPKKPEWVYDIWERRLRGSFEDKDKAVETLNIFRSEDPKGTYTLEWREKV